MCVLCCHLCFFTKGVQACVCIRAHAHACVSSLGKEKKETLAEVASRAELGPPGGRWPVTVYPVVPLALEPCVQIIKRQTEKEGEN